MGQIIKIDNDAKSSSDISRVETDLVEITDKILLDARAGLANL